MTRLIKTSESKDRAIDDASYQKKAEEYLRKKYVRRIEPDEDGGFVATIQEFPGLVAEGESVDEAYEALSQAAKAWLEVSFAHGRHVPEPYDFEGCSGKLALRLPRSLHRQAAELAALEDTSLNQFLVTAIAHYVGGKSVAGEIKQEIRSTRVVGNAYYLVNTNHFNIERQVSSGGLAIQEQAQTLQLNLHAVSPKFVTNFLPGMKAPCHG